MPADLPDKAAAVPHAQFVLVPHENPASLLAPVPFVAEAISGDFDRNLAGGGWTGRCTVHLPTT